MNSQVLEIFVNIIRDLYIDSLLYNSTIFIIVSLIGGFPFAIVYGCSIGVPVLLSCILVICFDLLLAFFSIQCLYCIEKNERVQPFLRRLRDKYHLKSPDSTLDLKKFGLMGMIVLSAMLVGWWVAVLLSYFLELKLKITMKSIVFGLSLGALVYGLIYSGLTLALSNPLILTIVFLGIVLLLSQLSKKIL